MASPCMSNTNCTPPQVCNLTNQTCVACGTTGACTASTECCEGFECTGATGAKTCTAIVCADNDDCPGTMVCDPEEDECKPCGVALGECTTAAECCSGFTCDTTAKKCIAAAPCGEGGDECEEKADCCEGHFCALNKKCKKNGFIAVYITIGVVVLILLCLLFFMFVMLSRQGKSRKSLEQLTTSVERMRH